MPTTISLPAKTLSRFFGALALIMPKGSNTVPVALSLFNHRLSLYSSPGCVCQLCADVECVDIAEARFMYCDIQEFLKHGGESIDITIENEMITFDGENFSCSFQKAYSDMEENDYEDLNYVPISSQSYIDTVKRLTGINMEKLFVASHPLSVYGDISLLRYPNCYIQVRSIGLPFQAIIDLQHVNLLTRFVPKEVSTDIPDSLVLKSKDVVIQLPCKYSMQENDFMNLLEDLCDTPIQLNIEGYVDKIRSATKFKGHLTTRIGLYSLGLRTTITTENTDVSVSVGDVSTQPLISFSLPHQVWIAYLNALGDGIIQILYGGGKICLRNKNMAIVTSYV